MPMGVAALNHRLWAVTPAGWKGGPIPEDSAYNGDGTPSKVWQVRIRWLFAEADRATACVYVFTDHNIQCCKPELEPIFLLNQANSLHRQHLPVTFAHRELGPLRGT